MDISTELMDLDNGLFASNTFNDDELLKLSLQRLEERWDNLPDEKFQSQERAIPAMLFINGYIQIKNFKKAYKWAEIMLSDRQDDLSDVGFTLGKIDFEAGNYESAYKNFTMAFQDSKGRVFQGKDPKYLEIIKHPDNFLKVK